MDHEAAAVPRSPTGLKMHFVVLLATRMAAGYQPVVMSAVSRALMVVPVAQVAQVEASYW
jgi:tRNA G18 (ribose-2'-O)-methylase SpoU